MNKKSKRIVSEFEITEECLPLHGWQGEDGQDRLSVIEEDIRNLMRGLAEARFASSEQEREHKEKARRLLLVLIEVLDAFGRVFSSIHTKEKRVTPQMKIWIANFRTVRRLLEKVVAEQGITKIESLDREFDPRWHKAIEVVVDTSKPQGTIVEEAASGYLWRDEILRKAEVIVVSDAADAPKGSANVSGQDSDTG